MYIVMITVGNAVVSMVDCVTGMRSLEDGMFDLVCSDPPYNINRDIVGDSNEDDIYLDFMRSWLREANRVLKPTGSIYVMCSLKYQPYIHQIMKDETGLHHLNTIIWAYSGNTHGAKYQLSHSYEVILLFTKSEEGYTFNMDDFRDPFGFTRFDKKNSRKGKALGDVWNDIPYLRWNHPERYGFYDKKTKKGGHPTQKPVALFKRMILLSTNEGDTVLDPFAGTGTSGVVCLQHGRKYTGYEVDQRWIEIIQKRLKGAHHARLDNFVNDKNVDLISYIKESR